MGLRSMMARFDRLPSIISSKPPINGGCGSGRSPVIFDS